MKQINLPTTMAQLVALSAGGIIGIAATMTDSFLVAVDGKAFVFPSIDPISIRKTTSGLFGAFFDTRRNDDEELQRWKAGLKQLPTGDEGENIFDTIIRLPALAHVVCVVEPKDIQEILDSSVTAPEGTTIH